MRNIINSYTLSNVESKGLEKTFFSPQTGSNYSDKKKKTPFILISVTLLILIIIFLAGDLKIVVLTSYNKTFQKETVDLLAKNEDISLELIDPAYGSKFTQEIVYVEMPFDKKTGFSLNFNEHVDLSNSEIVLIIRNPEQDFNINVILRDASFYSNALSPIALKIPRSIKRTGYVEVPILLGDEIAYNFRLRRISQVRFIFFQEKVEFLHLFVKHVFFKKKDGVL